MSWFREMFDGVKKQRKAPAPPEPSIEVDGVPYTAADVRALLAARSRLIEEHEAVVSVLQRALYDATEEMPDGA